MDWSKGTKRMALEKESNIEPDSFNTMETLSHKQTLTALCKALCLASAFWLAESHASAQTTNVNATPTREPIFKLFFFAGASSQNPYNIKIRPDGTGLLEKRSTSTDGYIEALVSARYITRTGFEDYGDNTNNVRWVSPLPFKVRGLEATLPDMQFRLGYVFRDSSSPSNFTSQTIVGGSDIYGEVSMGFPAFRYISRDGLTKGQATMEVSGGFVTDRNILTIHPSLFLGAGHQLRDQVGANTWYWISRVGLALVDYPMLGSGSTVSLNDANEPAFEAKWAPSMGTLVIYPLTSAISVHLGANAYFTKPPASWNVTFGLSLDLAKVLGK